MLKKYKHDTTKIVEHYYYLKVWEINVSER